MAIYISGVVTSFIFSIYKFMTLSKESKEVFQALSPSEKINYTIEYVKNPKNIIQLSITTVGSVFWFIYLPMLILYTALIEK
jgi:hypothetical protein